MSHTHGKRHSPNGEPVAPGTILGVGGDVLSQPGEFNFAEGEPHHDETVYELWETVQPQPQNRKIGETFGVQLPVKPGWMFCTAKIPGENNPDDCMLVYLRGTVPPPKGTRFAVRMLRPFDQEGSDATKKADDQGREAAEGSQGHARVQDGESQIGRRREGEEPQAGDRDSARGERPEPAEAPEETLAAKLAQNPEAKAVLDDGLDDYGPDGL